jgi:amino acid adenylation domain-containing protein
MYPSVPLYNEPFTVFRTGPLDVSALEQALGEIVRRHEAWRTNFEPMDGEPVQVVHPATAIRLQMIDLRTLLEVERERRVQAIAVNQARKPFDLRRDRLFRATLVCMADAEYRLCMTLHHLIFDGVSVYHVFLNELVSLYNLFSAGQTCSLPELPIQYGDFAYWQRQHTPDPKQMTYWRHQLSGELPVLQVTTDHPRPAVQTYRGAIHRFVLPKELSEGLKQLSRAEGSTLFMMLLTGFLTLLYRYSGQDDIVVGTVTGARKRQEVEPLLGCFQNPLPLRTNLSGDPTIRELLARVRKTTLGALSNDEVPFQHLVSELCTERDASRHPFFDVLFSLVPPELVVSPGWSVTQFNVDTGLAKFDIYLELQDKSESLEGRFIYNTDLFSADRIEGIAQHLRIVLGGILADPSQRLSRLPLLTEGERQKILVEWNLTARDYPQSSVAELFEQRVNQTPDAVALVHGEKHISYRDLNQRANQLAHHLRSLGIGPDAPVGICLKRSPEMVVGLLGILKAGGAYVPLDPGHPGERLSFMLQDTRASVLLTEQCLLGHIPRNETRIVCVDTDREFISRCPVENLASSITPDNLAYVTYTSGSTGSPKGVEIRHRSIVRLLFGVEYVEITSQDTFLSLAPIAFDASTFEIWGPLLHGARCVLFSDQLLTVEGLGQALRVNGVTILWLTASLFNTVIDEAPEILTMLRRLLIGGEALSVEHVRRACQLLPKIRITNGYGPTESTTFACCHQILSAPGLKARSIPIGRPIANTKVYVLDQDLNPVPVGIAGELHIGGVGLARGYLNRPELTAEKFIASPFEAGERLYKTGDVVRYLESGELEFLGRRDEQVKIRGYRVELGEVEAVLGRHPGVGELVVVARGDEGGEKRLVAYIVAAKGVTTTARELRKYVQEKLPEYMVPWGYVFLESLPLTPNGKVDRRRLPEAEEEASEGRGEVGGEPRKGPCDVVEERLVKIWEEVLGKKWMGVEENFFELGGHSLLAVRVMHRIEQEMGSRLPITALLQAPTVERLAEVVRRGEASEGWSSLVAIQPEGWRPPFFCVHGIGGTVLCFYDLARHLGPDQPVYGLQAQGLSGKHPCHTRVEDMAAHYVTEIRRLQPHGPYYIAGLSFGGEIAFEIAQQLSIQGEEIAFLALLDSYLPKREPGVFAKLFQASTREGYFQLLRKLESLPQGVQRRLSNLRLPRALKKVRAAALQAERQYVAQAYPGRVTLFRATETDLACVDDQVNAWRSVALGGVEICEIPGDHASIMLEPQIRQLAAKIRTCLDKTRSPWTSSPQAEQLTLVESGNLHHSE